MSKEKKHPKHMTDEEVLDHVFHPKIASAVREHLKGQSKPKPKRKPKQ